MNMPSERTTARVAPQSAEAERAVLGGMMLDPESVTRLGSLTPADFYRYDHKLIFEAIVAMAARGDSLDIVTVAEHLRATGKLMETGGLAYLGDLIAETPSAANIGGHAQIVLEHARRRALLALAAAIQDSTHAMDGRNTGQLVAEAEAQLLALGNRAATSASGPVLIRESLRPTIDRIETLFENGSALVGVSTGFSDLDDLTSGLPASELIVLGARPSMGKTTLASNIAEYVAIKDAPVLFVSLEMDTHALTLRLLASMGNIDLSRLRSGRLQEQDWPRLTSAVSMLQDAPLYIDDTGGLTVAEIHARARRIEGLGLIVVDYLGLVAGEGETQTLRIGAMTRALKNTAKALRVPVLLLAQLNRSLEQRPNKRPVPADLRDSGEIEQDADQIWFLYRDEVYNPETPDKGIAEIHVAKNRNGAQGTVRLTFRGECTRFGNYFPDVVFTR